MGSLSTGHRPTCWAGDADSSDQGRIPASPYRRMDAGAIGSMVADYPLRLMPIGDPMVAGTLALGDPRFKALIDTVAELASPTGQWNGRRRFIPSPAAVAWGTVSMDGPRRSG
ncbi:MAG: hypothetical protein RBT11_14890 [Desulfobacterales bacterium]|nr:hypothetical protein [Desulfobacterales bacterium]